ncbi:hypothetical protein C2E21_7390 [Chlorella sorokiniana]|uniref:Uncharacterized protein n=1 Tax=Chlorella sorokiniana TaxID=3076 RepID=A0A2P6TI15_CHLSO|nr:hypothetical protein C2E21_7390 [Chlorella sorokiniana]|eukprot:PRW33933.1 hypothetical protein C2E21_7390 [Chlorella sorokiniana]
MQQVHLRGAARWLGLSKPARPACRGLVASNIRCESSGGEPGSSEGEQASDAVFKGFGRQQQPPTAADALQNTLAAASSSIGRTSSSNNVILDTTSDESKWRELDLQVNEYPGQRTFKAIGTGDQDFVAAMTECVESVVGTVHAECVQQRLSAKGNYISVTVGPVWVETPDQVLKIYENMKADGRLRFFF